MTAQRTLKTEFSIAGVGVHSGQMIQLKVKPAKANQGIVFVRTDLEGTPHIPALHRNVVCTRLATTLGLGKATVSTVEHILAAFYGLGIDNATIEVNGAEVPIMDGSSRVFCEAIRAAGTELQCQTRRVLALRKKVEVKLGEKWAVAEPSSGFQIFGSIDWDHPSIGYQEFFYQEGKTPFEELAGARTFGFLKDIEALQKAGLARGGSLDNAIVLNEALILNPEGLRYPNEFVRHKILDALGDFMLAGVHLQGLVRLHRAGHDLHCQLLTEILKNPANYELLPADQAEVLPKAKGISVHALLARSLAALYQ